MDSAVSQPNLGPSNKSASRIREMLESVRGRMAAVVSQSSISSMLPDNHNNQITTSASKIPTKSGQVAIATTRSPSVVSVSGQKIKPKALKTEPAAGKPNKSFGLNKSGNSGDQTDDKDLQMNLLRTLEDIQCDIKFLRDRLKNDFEITREQLANYFSADSSAKLNSLSHDCMCNILTFGKHLKETTAAANKSNNNKGNKYKTHLDTIRDKCTLKRASSISSRLASKAAIRRGTGDRMSVAGALISLAAPTTVGTTNTNQLQPIHDDVESNRASFGGYIPSERRQSSLVYRNPQQQQYHAPSRSMASSKLVRASSTCSSMVKSSLSSLSSQATTGANTSSSANTSDHDDLHDGLMRLLDETNSLRNSDKMRISMGSIRRFSDRLIDLSD